MSTNTPNELFEASLTATGEVGFVSEVYSSLVHIVGLPNARPNERVVFENGETGQIISLKDDHCEVLLFTTKTIRSGDRVARTNKHLSIGVGNALLGTMITPLGVVLSGKIADPKSLQDRTLNVTPSGMVNRKAVDVPLETGYSIVDLLVPLGMGQRELVIGDRKTGKSSFLLQVMRNQAQKGTICIYCGIGKRRMDIASVQKFCANHGIEKQTIMVVSTSLDPAGVIFLTPYAAMSIAEYFRELGSDVLIIMDDLTSHAQYYREITLLARRFPGRSSYPGDIFYIHSRLLERAGSFKKGTITCLPVAESVLGDLSGYIQTNLMAITDGHIFFDSEVFNEGRRPAINAFLSVTRVGEQAQSDLLRDLSRQLSRFLVHYQRLRELVHFGTEFEDRVRKDLALGSRIFSFFNQTYDLLVPLPVSIFIIAILWNGLWAEDSELISQNTNKLVDGYLNNAQTRAKIDKIVKDSKTFQELVVAVREDPSFIA